MELPKALSSRRVWIWAGGLLIAVSLYCVVSYAIGFVRRKACAERISALGYAISKHTGRANRFPSKPMDLVPDSMTSLRVMMCPAVRHQEKGVPDGTNWGDYTYINWSDHFDTPTEVPFDHPLLYDRAMSNHGGRGLNIVRVGGDVIWGPGATWLRDFAARHPEYAIPIPKE